MTTATATFEIQMTPADAGLDGVGRFDLTKQWRGDLRGTSTGIMLSAGNPEAGGAGYVAIEVFTGTLADVEGTFAFQQFGTMSGDEQRLTYEIAPGSGTGGLVGLTGTVTLTVDDTHHVELAYDLPSR